MGMGWQEGVFEHGGLRELKRGGGGKRSVRVRGRGGDKGGCPLVCSKFACPWGGGGVFTALL